MALKSNQFSCFFCLRERDSRNKRKNSGRISNSSDYQFPLGSVRRYLGLSEEVENCEKNLNLSDSLMVSACKNCSEMTRKFMKLFKLLEETKLKLNSCLQEMHDVMVDSSCGEVSNEDEEILRTEIIDKMKEKIAPLPTPPTDFLRTKYSPATPEVFSSTSSSSPAAITNISSLSVEPNRNPNHFEISIKVDNDYFHCEDEDEDSRFELEGDGDDGDEEWNEMEETSNGILLAKPERQQHYTSTSTKDVTQNQNQTHAFCSMCRAKVEARNKHLIRHHTVQYHCEFYFPTHKLPSIDDFQFKKILAELLFKDFISTSCNYCSKQFTLPPPSDPHGRTGNIRRIKSHYVQKHYKELEDLLLQIQRDPNLHKILEECNPHGKLCDCGVYLPNSESKMNHDWWHCRLISVGAGDSSSSSTSKRRKRNDIDSSSEIEIESHFEPIIPTRWKVICKACQKILNRKYARDHYKYRCRNGLRLPVQEQKRGLPSASGKNYPSNCPYCLYKCTATKVDGPMSFHLVRYHPQHFFLEMDSDNGLQRVIQDILYPEAFKKTGRYAYCQFCDKCTKEKETKSGDVYIKKHLMDNHRSEMKDKLKVIMEDRKLLEERLKTCNPNGIFCQCGEYMPEGVRNQNYTYHEKNFCKSRGKGVGVVSKPEESRSMEADGGDYEPEEADVSVEMVVKTEEVDPVDYEYESN